MPTTSRAPKRAKLAKISVVIGRRKFAVHFSDYVRAEGRMADVLISHQDNTVTVASQGDDDRLLRNLGYALLMVAAG